MRKPLYLLFAILFFCSHDLYIKMDTYFLQPNQEAILSLYNGTFERSENSIARDRMLDASIITHGERTAISPDQWEDQDSTITQLTFNTGREGTYVTGVSTKARNIELIAEKFNDYLKHDGVLDMLQERSNNGLLNEDAVESYEKHVKAIYQVGNLKTKDWSTALNYPIEFVPMENPYEKFSGETLEVQLLLHGQPLSNQPVYANHVKNAHANWLEDHGHKHEHGDGHDHTHEHDGEDHSHDHAHSDSKEHNHSDNIETGDSHTHTSGQQLRTNDEGRVLVDLAEDGIYYLRTIYMTRVTDDDTLTHRSKWATLTFEVTHKHGTDTHTHDHDHEHNIPTWVFVLGSFLVVGVLFFIFRKKK